MAGQFISRRQRRGSGGGYRPISEINVTPFDDVMLVLLIVFMVTAPLLTVGVPVDLPKTQAKALSQPEEPLVISIKNEGAVFIQEDPIDIEKLIPRLVAITDNKPDTRIYLRGDQTVNYGRIMDVMARVNTAGFTQLALVTDRKKYRN